MLGAAAWAAQGGGMVERTALCQCGQLKAVCEGDPVRVSVCHCLDCQRRSGSAFAAQARWPKERVRIEGERREWSRVGDEGGGADFRFCPRCGSTVFYTNRSMPDLIAVAVGALADPSLPLPAYSVYEGRKHPWVTVEAAEHLG